MRERPLDNGHRISIRFDNGVFPDAIVGKVMIPIRCRFKVTICSFFFGLDMDLYNRRGCILLNPCMVIPNRRFPYSNAPAKSFRTALNHVLE